MSASSLSVAAFAAICIKPLMSYVGDQPDKLAFTGIGCRLLSIVSFGLVVTHVMAAYEEDISNTWLIITTCASVTISLYSHMHATSLTTLTTGVVSREERGAIIGLEHGLGVGAAPSTGNMPNGDSFFFPMLDSSMTDLKGTPSPYKPRASNYRFSSFDNKEDVQRRELGEIVERM